jgi:filamin
VRAYGPGIEPSGPVVGAPANFTVETFSAGKGKIEVTVENPNGQLEPVSACVEIFFVLYSSNPPETL